VFAPETPAKMSYKSNNNTSKNLLQGVLKNFFKNKAKKFLVFANFRNFFQFFCAIYNEEKIFAD
jgi:hypothetical protein